MNWSSKPPRISGWWFVGQSTEPLRLHVWLVEVREKKHRWQWTYSGRKEWLPVEDFPDYKWAGPIRSPSLDNFNKAVRK